MAKIKGVPDEIAYASLNIVGNRTFTVTNYKGIIECSDTKIRINTSDFVVSISGEKFRVVYISSEEFGAEGIINSVEFVV